MCPLRIILIFLSATLAGFFVLRNLKSPQPEDPQCLVVPQEPISDSDNRPQNSSKFSKVCSAVESGFWTCVDMASGRYLWRHLVGHSPESKRSE